MGEQIQRDAQTGLRGGANRLEHILQRIPRRPVVRRIDVRTERIQTDAHGLQPNVNAALQRGGHAAVGIEVDRAIRTSGANLFDGLRDRNRAKQRLAFAALAERNNAVRNTFQMINCYARKFLRRCLKRDPGLRRRQTRLRFLLGNAAYAARVTLWRYGKRRFAALQKDVLSGKTAIFARAQTDLVQNAIEAIGVYPLLDDPFEFPRCKLPRLPILALVGAHCGSVQFVVDDASKRVTEQRKRRGIRLALVCRQQQTRVAGWKHDRKRVATSRDAVL